MNPEWIDAQPAVLESPVPTQPGSVAAYLGLSLSDGELGS
jgi:hypothetical protein